MSGLIARTSLLSASPFFGLVGFYSTGVSLSTYRMEATTVSVGAMFGVPNATEFKDTHLGRL
jgi:hypothetical protein